MIVNLASPARADFALEPDAATGLVVIRPLNPRAASHLRENIIADDWYWFGSALACDAALVRKVVNVLAAKGFAFAAPELAVC